MWHCAVQTPAKNNQNQGAGLESPFSKPPPYMWGGGGGALRPPPPLVRFSPSLRIGATSVLCCPPELVRGRSSYDRGLILAHAYNLWYTWYYNYSWSYLCTTKLTSGPRPPQALYFTFVLHYVNYLCAPAWGVPPACNFRCIPSQRKSLEGALYGGGTCLASTPIMHTLIFV